MHNFAFNIYTYNLPKQSSRGLVQWEKKETVSDISYAFEKAERLFESGKFQKVEIKQIYYDKKKGRNIDVTVKAFETKPKIAIDLSTIIGLVTLLGILSFILAYLISQTSISG